MAPSEVRVAYTLYPSGSAELQAALEGVRAQFPLRNLHWKPSTRPTLRTMQEVDVRLVDLKDVPPGKDTVAGSVLESPLVQVCFVCCDDPDVYKHNTKTFIKDWLSLLASRRPSHTPMIVLVNPFAAGHSAQSSKNVFGRDKGIIAKLRTDFNVNKRDICAQLNLPPAGTTDPATWIDVTNKLKESIVTAFDAAILEREDDVKRGEAQKVTVGWNFSTWFLLKESLAHSFEGVNLWEDALIIYEELEASFLQALKDRNLSWFDRLGGTDPTDDSLPILDTGAKAYRDMLTASAISVFDFRIYLFACQCKVLGKLGRVTEIAKRGQWFVASLARRLREAQSELPQFFIESWTYSACMDLVARCDDWSRIDRPNNDYSGLIAYESARAELLDIARVQAERIGVAVGLLPQTYPFQAAAALQNSDMLFKKPETNGETAPHSDKPLSNKIFVDALEDKDAFIRLYIDLTNQALQAYEACGKVNSAVRLKADLAALALHMQDFDSAYILCRNLAHDCADLHVWDPVAKFALVGALRAHTELQRPQDDEWAQMAVAYLDVCSGSLAPGTDKEQLQVVINSLRDLGEARQVKETIVFKLRLLDDVARVSQDDPTVTELQVEVDNTLPIPMDVDNVWLELESESYGIVSYGSGPVSLGPGRQVLTLTCATSISGAAALRDGGVVLRNISFLAPFPSDQAVVPVQRSPRAIRAGLHMPDEIALDEEPRVVLDVKSGEHALGAVRLSVISLQEEVHFDVERTTGEETGEPYAFQDGYVDLGDLSPGETVTVTFPYSGVPRNELARARITIEYDSASGRRCKYLDDQGVFMGLPVTVNVQDFFRPDELVSSYSIASDGREYIRVGSVDLQSGSEGIYQIQPCRSKWEQPILISPTQPLACLFKIKTLGDPSGEMLRLAIRYQTVDEELLHAAEGALASVTGAKGVQVLARLARTHVAERGPWLQPYLLDSDVRSVFGPDFHAAAAAASVPSSTVDAFVSALKPMEPRWRTLRIPVDVPLGRLLTTVHLTPSSAATIYEGRALSFELRLDTSIAWLGKAAQEYRVTYDVQPSADDWVVVGKKRGVYVATPGKTEVQSLVLVPVRYGTLALPPISVQLIDKELSAPGPDKVWCETYVANAAQGIRVLPARTRMAALVPVAPDWAE